MLDVKVDEIVAHRTGDGEIFEVREDAIATQREIMLQRVKSDLERLFLEHYPSKKGPGIDSLVFAIMQIPHAVAGALGNLPNPL